MFITIILVATQFTHLMGMRKKMESFVVNGKDAAIEDFPHSVFLAIRCHSTISEQYACGGSIITQRIVLSAGHCFEGCNPEKTMIMATVGAAQFSKGRRVPVEGFRIHEKYNKRGFLNDIALVILKFPIKFNDKVKKVYLMENPPRGVAEVAGWGLTNETEGTETLILQQAAQKILPRKQCLKILEILPKRAFCASSVEGYAAEGDSGSALMVNGYIQIGLVSYKNTKVSVSIIVYTNVSAYFDWINKNIYELQY